ncbi:MAG TPA: RNA polymerase sigma factor [Chthoniobacteraceae bacterium]|nr:RNA polymerase sigma factor [Chthoniobacteraceae bacterium]
MDPSDPSDKSLIEAALRGDTAAFEMLIQIHSRTLFAIAYAILRDASEAEDIVQETFVRAWKRRHWMRDPAKFPAWLTTVARNRACDLLRKRRTVSLDAAGPALNALHEMADTGAQSPGDTAADLHRQVHAALGDLPEQHRTALTLRYLEGMDHLSIERAMGLTNGALRGILGRALAAMRKTLKPATEICE